MGGMISAPSLIAILNSCKSPSDSATSSFNFAADQKNLVAEIAEMIIPKTDTPGAKDVGVQDIMETLLKDCYSEEQQKHFLAGLKTLEDESKKIGKSFIDLDNESRNQVLNIMKGLAQEEAKKNQEEKEKAAKEIDSESGATKQNQTKAAPPIPFFNLMRDLTLFGYYSSEYAINNEYNYQPVPGKYDGCITVDANANAYS